VQKFQYAETRDDKTWGVSSKHGFQIWHTLSQVSR